MTDKTNQKVTTNLYERFDKKNCSIYLLEQGVHDGRDYKRYLCSWRFKIKDSYSKRHYLDYLEGKMQAIECVAFGMGFTRSRDMPIDGNHEQ